MKFIYTFILTFTAYRPQTKGKVENIVKLLNELYAYNGMLDYTELVELVKKIMMRWNLQVHQTTREVPIISLQKEKDSLLTLPHERIRNRYKITNRFNYTRLKENLEYINLKQCNHRIDEIIELTQNRTMSVIDILLKLTDYEVDIKKQNVKESMIKVANFPYNRSLDDFDFSFNSDMNQLEIRNLASLNFIENNKNLIFIGNSGIGKTHLATAIGRLTASSRYSTYFIKYHDLLANLKAALVENRLEQRLKYYSK